MKIKSSIGFLGLWEGGRRAFDCCRSVVCAVLMIAALAGQPSSAHAEPPTAAQIAECRAWAQHYWNWVDIGEIDPAWLNFDFSFPTGGNFNPLLPSLVAFEEIYAARLGGTYTLEDLLRDDPAVLQAFRHHSITGEVTTPVSDPPATEVHLRLIVGALQSAPAEAAEPCDEVTSSVSDDGLYFAMSGASLQSNIIVTKKKLCPTPGPAPLPPTSDPFRDRLEEALRNLGLEEHYDCLRLEDGGWWFSDPGFDCDDFALAARNWLSWVLRNQFPNARYGFLHVQWFNDGHAMVLIEHEGKWYVIDPQTGRVEGPFSSPDAQELKDAVWRIMRDEYGVDSPWWPRVTPYDAPNWGPREPDHWHADPDLRERVKDCLGIDDDGPIVDPAPGTPALP
jgi:hypothetical protein